MTPWNKPGARWHIHLPVSDEIRDYVTALHPVLQRYADRMQILPVRYLHCTLAWANEPIDALARRLNTDAEAMAETLAHRALSRLSLAMNASNYEQGQAQPQVPVEELSWAPGGPVLSLTREPIEATCAAAQQAIQDIAGEEAVKGGLAPTWRPHIAIGYATTTWLPAEVVELDAQLRTTATSLPLPAPLPVDRVQIVAQDTFSPKGLTWHSERIVQVSSLAE